MEKQGVFEIVGISKITKAYNLPSKHIIHTVGPRVKERALTISDEIMLSKCYGSCLMLAYSYKLNSLAFCSISTGVFFPKLRAAKIATETIKTYFNLQKDNFIKDIIFCVFDEVDKNIYLNLLNATDGTVA